MGVLCESRSLLKTERGPIWEIAFAGRFGDGSQGNSDADEMMAYVTRVVKNDRPAAVLFNLSNLAYEFGDAIGGIAFPLIVKGKSVTPACFVANGTTAQALQWLFQKNTIFCLARFKLFSDREQAVAFLRERINKTQRGTCDGVKPNHRT
jgi:hypothetical protein